MNDTLETLRAEQKLDIFAKRVLAKAILSGTQEVFQENTNPTGEKLPLKLFIINNGSTPAEQPAQPNPGSAVKCVKLAKRVIAGDYPQNTVICTQKSRVTVRFQLVLIVEYENGTFDVITLPKNLSSRLQYSAATTKAFVDSTVINDIGTPVLQRQNKVVPYESLNIVSTGVNAYTAFDYTVTIPLSQFDNLLKSCELEDPSLQSYILLRNLDYDVDILDVFQLFTNAANTTSVWTTIVNFSLLEDIIDKLGIDQDISILGTPEFEC